MKNRVSAALAARFYGRRASASVAPASGSNEPAKPVSALAQTPPPIVLAPTLVHEVADEPEE